MVELKILDLEENMSDLTIIAEIKYLTSVF